MNLFRNCFMITIFGSSLAFGQFGQSGLLEYKVYSRGGNSSFTSVDTLGMTEKEIDFIEKKVQKGSSSSNQQSGLFEYEVYSQGGNSSFISVDTAGMTEKEIELIKENIAHGTPTDDHQSGLFEYETTGLGGNSSFISVDESGFTKADEEKAVQISEVIYPREESEVEVAETANLSEIAVK